jgi:hypothetical protein
MRSFTYASAAAATIAATITGVAAADLPPIVIKGSKFFYENNGTQLYESFHHHFTPPACADSTPIVS